MCEDQVSECFKGEIECVRSECVRVSDYTRC